MAIKNVVKVMNFHSLLRVDKARRIADKYKNTEDELTAIIRKILLNKNIILDKKSIIPNKKNPILNIYIGNDLGFCGDFNFSINKEVRKDKNIKILIGSKIHNFNDQNIILRMTKEDFFSDFSKVENIIYDAIKNDKYSMINVIYNHYHNVNHLEFTKKTIYPFKYDSVEGETYDEDFGLETDSESMLSELVSLYICYEIKICEMNSFAAENVIRQTITRESLKKIDEIEAEKTKEERKIKKQKDFKAILENFRKF